jgi:glycogen operon protein
MLLAGDERNRTQQGNNNAYCQDNAISWVDWTEDPSGGYLTTAVRSLIALRAGVPALRAARFPEPGPPAADGPVAGTGLAWFNPDGSAVTSQDWGNAEGHSFAVVFPDAPPAPSALVMINAYWNPLPFTVPSPPAGAWTARVDTMQEDGTPAPTPPLGAGASVTVGPRSIVIATG